MKINKKSLAYSRRDIARTREYNEYNRESGSKEPMRMNLMRDLRRDSKALNAGVNVLRAKRREKANETKERIRRGLAHSIK